MLVFNVKVAPIMFEKWHLAELWRFCGENVKQNFPIFKRLRTIFGKITVLVLF